MTDCKSILIEYNKDCLPIQRFKPINIGKFTIITGKNGSGKTKFLHSIINKSLLIKTEKGILDTLYYDYNSFNIESENKPNSSKTVFKNRNKGFEESPFIDRFIQEIKENGTINMPVKPSDKSEEKSWRIECKFKMPLLQWYDELNDERKKYFLGLDDHNAKLFLSNNFNPLNFDQKFISNIFSVMENYYYNLYHETAHYKDKNFSNNQSIDDFILKYGTPPWEVVNNTLEMLGLKYRLQSPMGMIPDFYREIKFVEGKENIPISLALKNLSSGERIILALSVSIFKAKNMYLPGTLFLFDEIDATLHPSMIRLMMKIIYKSFIKKGANVIMTTHNPSTIACSQDYKEKADIYSIDINKNSENHFFEKISADEALSILSDGFITFSDGIKLFEKLHQDKINILTEGNNAKYIQEIANISNLENVNVLHCSFFNKNSGWNQLDRYYDFLDIVVGAKKANFLFVYDSDADSKKITHDNNQKGLFAFKFQKNSENTVAEKGIENIFPSDIFAENVTHPSGKFNKSCKDIFLHQCAIPWMKENNILAKELFRPLIDKINSIVELDRETG